MKVLPFSGKKYFFAEAGFGAAITSILGLAGLYLPFLSFFSGLFAPLPLIYLVRKYNLQTGVITLLIASVLMYLSTGNSVAVVLAAINFGLLGLLIGLLFKNYVSAGKSIFIIFIAASILTLAGIFIMTVYGNVNIFALNGEAERILEQMMQFYQENNIVDLNDIETKAMLKNMIRISILFLPGSIVLWSVTSASLTYLLSRLILKRLNYETVSLPPFSEWKLPWYSVWAIIIGLLFALVGDELGQQALALLGKNILFVFSFVFAFTGVSVLTYLYKYLRLSAMVKLIILFILLLYIPAALLLVIILGVLDPLFALRDKLGKGEKS